MNDKETPASEPDWWAEQNRNEAWIQEQEARLSKLSKNGSGTTNDTQQKERAA